jgi:hypothetical protein
MTSTGAKMRQRGPSHAMNSEEIGFDQPARFVDGRLLERSDQCPACVVHYDVQTPCLVQHDVNRCANTVVVGDVEHHWFNARTGRSKRLARGTEHAKPIGSEPTGDGLTNPA